MVVSLVKRPASAGLLSRIGDYLLCSTRAWTGSMGCMLQQQKPIMAEEAYDLAP